MNQIYILLCVIAMGQKHVFVDERRQPSKKFELFIRMKDGFKEIYATMAQCRDLTNNLLQLDRFYDGLGGLLGYQQKSLDLLSTKRDAHHKDVFTEYLMPNFLDMAKDTEETHSAIRAGIEGIPRMAEIYALGGSGDRLGLECPESGELLPAAMLPYCGRSMLDSMIRDLQVQSLFAMIHVQNA